MPYLQPCWAMIATRMKTVQRIPATAIEPNRIFRPGYNLALVLKNYNGMFGLGDQGTFYLPEHGISVQGSATQ